MASNPGSKKRLFNPGQRIAIHTSNDSCHVGYAMTVGTSPRAPRGTNLEWGVGEDYRLLITSLLAFWKGRGLCKIPYILYLVFHDINILA